MSVLYGVVSLLPQCLRGRIVGGPRVSDTTSSGGVILGVVSSSFDLVQSDCFVSDGSAFHQVDRVAYMAKRKQTVFDLLVLDGLSLADSADQQ